MQLLRTEAEFQQMPASKHAIAFVCFEWPGQSKLTERLVEQWERDWPRQSRHKCVPLYRISPDETPFLQGWIAENARSDEEGMEGGFGSLLWLRNGKVVRYVRYAAETGPKTLSQLTAEHLTG